MGTHKSWDQTGAIPHLVTSQLRDVQTLHSGVITPKSLQLSVAKIEKRIAMEGPSFATKHLPRLGKAFDKALTQQDRLDSASLGFKPGEGSLPLFLGELFRKVLDSDGRVLPEPCVGSIKSLRQVLYSFYKYELPYDAETENAVIQKFVKTEDEVRTHSRVLASIADSLDAGDYNVYRRILPKRGASLIRIARRRLYLLFKHFDHRDIVPAHGPGAVSTKEKLWEKWQFTKVNSRIRDSYPLDEYFHTSLGHVADRLQDLQRIEEVESPARVCLVPKDSRGPRIISCESLANQFVQQGLGRAIVRHVERHPLTAFNVRFTDQGPNQKGALLGSSTGKYATLDLNEASDRVSVGLVRLLFPGPLVEALMNCRSLATVLPGGEHLILEKYAPMGSSLCFPVLALTVWALLDAGAPDTDTRRSILVYGDDVIVPTAYAADAIKILTMFGLKVNVDKSCLSGFFRESCGVEAYNGVNVTPVRLHTVWANYRCPEALASWCEYANAFYKRSFFYTYDSIAGGLFSMYERIPESDKPIACPSLMEVPVQHRPQTRWSRSYQRIQQLSWHLKPRTLHRAIDGWQMLFRYLTESHYRRSGEIDENGILRLPVSLERTNDNSGSVVYDRRIHMDLPFRPYRVRDYTRRKALKLELAWH